MEKRLSRFRELLLERNLTLALITDENNIGYLCGYRFDDGCLLITPANAYIITDFRYEEEAKRYALREFSVVTPLCKSAFISDVAKKENAESIAYESRAMTVENYHAFKEAVSLPFIAMGDILIEMRAQKDREEINAIKTAQEIAEAAFDALLDTIHPHMTEREIALELSYFMQKNGAEKESFDIIAVSGDASALPHGKCRNLPISTGFLTLDFGCVYKGYRSDMTRTLSVGRACNEMKLIYKTVLEAQESAIQFIREGALCKDIDAVARGVIERAGYGDAFGHSLGHGVGLDIHELPTLSPRATARKLTKGNIITVEPGIYLAGKYGCRIEDMGLVTENGFENFTKTTKELIELFV